MKALVLVLLLTACARTPAEKRQVECGTKAPPWLTAECKEVGRGHGR